jgi:cell division protease FtsH
MVTQYGMSDELGPRVYGDKQEMVFLWREISEQRDYSDAIAEKIDREVREIIDTEYIRARQVLTENKDKLELIAQTLLEIESLDAEEFLALIEGQGPPTPPSSGNTPPPQPAQPKPSEPVEWKPSGLDMPPAPSPA